MREWITELSKALFSTDTGLFKQIRGSDGEVSYARRHFNRPTVSPRRGPWLLACGAFPTRRASVANPPRGATGPACSREFRLWPRTSMGPEGCARVVPLSGSWTTEAGRRTTRRSLAASPLRRLSSRRG